MISEIHELAWNTFMKATKSSRKVKAIWAGQDMLADAFSRILGVWALVLRNWNSQKERVSLLWHS